MITYFVIYLVLLTLVLMFTYGASKVTSDFHVANPKEGGYTLIELIIVTAFIAVIIVTIAVGATLLLILGKAA